MSYFRNQRARYRRTRGSRPEIEIQPSRHKNSSPGASGVAKTLIAEKPKRWRAGNESTILATGGICPAFYPKLPAPGTHVRFLLGYLLERHIGRQCSCFVIS